VSDLIAIAYPDLATAQDVAANAAALTKSRELELEDLVVIEHRQDGKIKLHQPSATGAGAAGGALWGGLIGLIFLAPLFGMAIGAAAGAAGGSMADCGVDDNFMKDMGEKLEPGGAAVVALVRKVTADKVLPNLKHQGTVIQTSLDAEREELLKQALANAGKE
jgi:uncharacterized membrane protein